MPTCKKCNNPFPYKKKIDGKVRNLKSRKYCLDCSPFGKHNTRCLETACNRPSISGNRVPFSKWSEKAKEENRARIFWRGYFRKQSLILIKGGSCEICGYCKHCGSLSFHHKDPGQKSFELNSRVLGTKNWEDILHESDKCQLLCLNCHGEIDSSDYALKRYEPFRKRFEKLYFRKPR